MQRTRAPASERARGGTEQVAERASRRTEVRVGRAATDVLHASREQIRLETIMKRLESSIAGPRG